MADKGDILYGVRLLRAAPLDPDGDIPETPEWVSVTTPQEAGISPVVRTGQEQDLRGGDALIATITEDDVVIGVDISFRDAVLSGEFMAIVAGGTWDATGGEYTPAAMNEARARFMAELYVAQYGEGSQGQTEVLGYTKFEFPSCSSVLPQFSSQDRNFLTPLFAIKARDNQKAEKRFMTLKTGVATLP